MLNYPMRWIIKPQVFNAEWPAPANIKTLISTRKGGVSKGPFSSLNLGDHVNDNIDDVVANRNLITAFLPAAPTWLSQVHGTNVIELTSSTKIPGTPVADGSFSKESNQVCCVMTADCLPVLLCNEQGTQVAAVHAGWRGLLDGIIEQAIDKFDSSDQLLAYLGPAIGPNAFEVGNEVQQAFCEQDHKAENAFKFSSNQGKWLADIYQLARIRLNNKGVAGIYGGDFCTVRDVEQFFSYRRDGQTGRMASCIWMEQNK